MLHILWLIIKFILIVLGIVLCLLLLAVLFLLFCPVRYRVEGYKPEGGDKTDIKASIQVSWLFHGIFFRFFFREGKTGSNIRIFGIPMEKFWRQKNKGNNKADIEADIKQEYRQEQIPVHEEEKKTPEGKAEEQKHPSQKKTGLLKKIVKKIKSIRLTLKRTCVKMEWWKKFLSNPRVKEALSFCWKDIKKLIHHIVPVKIEGWVTFGCEDPSLTGGILAVLGMSVPFHKNCIQVVPVFEEGRNILTGDIKMKGRIYGFVLLKTGIEIYFNKNIKYMINRWKHKED